MLKVWRQLLFRWSLCGLMLALASCKGGYEEQFFGNMRVLSGTEKSSKNGTATVKIRTNPNETSMLLTAHVEPPYLTHVRRVVGPDGTELFDAFSWTEGVRSKTNAGYVANTVTFNWPITAADPPLVGGADYTIELGIVDATGTYVKQPAKIDVAMKTDANINKGRLRVAAVYTGDLWGEDWFREGVDEAMLQWRDLYGAVGIDLVVVPFGYPTTELDPPGFGSEAEYLAIAKTTGTRTVNVVFVETIPDLDIYGISGDIPGPIIASERSAVLVSALAASGPDMRFSDEDIRLLAETLGHEVGHYLGLFHPVETTYDHWDALGDTPECTTETICRDTLADNLMYPTPICSVQGCIPQIQLTAEQNGVVQRYVGME